MFKISTNGALTSLYSFTGGNDGANPMPGWCRAATAISMARLPAAARNNYYRLRNYGTVFKISTNWGADQFVFIHTVRIQRR